MTGLSTLIGFIAGVLSVKVWRALRSHLAHRRNHKIDWEGL